LDSDQFLTGHFSGLETRYPLVGVPKVEASSDSSSRRTSIRRRSTDDTARDARQRNAVRIEVNPSTYEWSTRMTHESGVSSAEEHQLVEVRVLGRVGTAGHQCRACRVIVALVIVEAEKNVIGLRPSFNANPSNSSSDSCVAGIRESSRD